MYLDNVAKILLVVDPPAIKQIGSEKVAVKTLTTARSVDRERDLLSWSPLHNSKASLSSKNIEKLPAEGGRLRGVIHER
jgi:hypothetical protein